MLLFSITKYSAIPFKMSEGQISLSREGNGSLGTHFKTILEDLEYIKNYKRLMSLKKVQVCMPNLRIAGANTKQVEMSSNVSLHVQSHTGAAAEVLVKV